MKSSKEWIKESDRAFIFDPKLTKELTVKIQSDALEFACATIEANTDNWGAAFNDLKSKIKDLS